jgi:hypothetical protein
VDAHVFGHRLAETRAKRGVDAQDGGPRHVGEYLADTQVASCEEAASRFPTVGQLRAFQPSAALLHSRQQLCHIS